MVALSSDDSDTPKSRIPFATGKSGESRSVETSASSPAFAIGAQTALLRVICVKSAHFTFSVIVLA